MKHGIFHEPHKGLDHKDYISWSQCSAILQSPSLYYTRYGLGKRTPPSDQMELGSAFGMLLTDYEGFHKMYAVTDKWDLRTTAGKAAKQIWETNNAGKKAINDPDYRQIRLMNDYVFQDDYMMGLFQRGQPEACAYAKDDINGKTTTLFSKMDYVNDTIVIEVKTTKGDPRWESFQWEVRDRGYHGQLAFYLHTMKLLTGKVHAGVLVSVSTNQDSPGACFYTIGEAFNSHVWYEGEVMWRKAVDKIQYYKNLDPAMTNRFKWAPQQTDTNTHPSFFKHTKQQGETK